VARTDSTADAAVNKNGTGEGAPSVLDPADSTTFTHGDPILATIFSMIKIASVPDDGKHSWGGGGGKRMRDSVKIKLHF
jgi:hypothetical protein